MELGINVFDTADMYSAGVSEEITGRLLREFTRREEIVIATKVFYPVDLAFKGGNAPGPKPVPRPNMSGLSRKHIMDAVDASLKRLGTDYIDLYQIHRFDYATPVEETMQALHDVVRAGKVRYIGASSMWTWQFAKMQHAAERNGWTKFISMQNHYNLAYREEEREMIPYCRETGVAVMPWSPLARGFLAGNRSREDRRRRRRLARPHRRHRAQVLLPGRRLRRGGGARRAGQGAGRVHGHPRVRMAGAAARRGDADRGREQDLADRGGGEGARPQAFSRGRGGDRGAVPAASRAGARLGRVMSDRTWIRQAVRKIEADFNRSADTHLIPLPLPAYPGVHVYLKDESSHPTGSLKHRLARSLFLYSLCNGWLHEKSTVIESSSGSTAVSEAYFARLLGLPFVAVMPTATSPEKIAAIQFYGGRCHLVDPHEVYGESERLARELGGHYMDQFTYAERATDWRSNNNIAESIFSQLEREPHPVPRWVVCSAGTGGTTATIGRFVRYRCHDTKVCVVDPENSVFFDAFAAGDSSIRIDGSSLIEGIGRPRVERSFLPGIVDGMFRIPDARLARGHPLAGQGAWGGEAADRPARTSSASCSSRGACTRRESRGRSRRSCATAARATATATTTMPGSRSGAWRSGRPSRPSRPAPNVESRCPGP